MFVRAQVISRGAGRSVVSAAAYRHRTKMMDEQVGTQFRYEGGASELVHEELALPDATPAWLRAAIDGRSVAGASEALWNAVDRFEKRVDAQLAREMIFALPEELSRGENIELVREFVRDNLTSRGMVADWVYHDKDGNPHVHVMTTLRPLAEDGFGPKKVAVAGNDGEPIRVVTPDRPGGKIVYRLWAGDKETMKAWKQAWAESANRHLALAGHDIRLDGRSYEEQGLDGIAQRHLGPVRAARARKGLESYFAPNDLARRFAAADKLAGDPSLLLKQLSNERSTFDERDIARALHRIVDDPVVFANIRAELMASSELVTLRPARRNAQTGKVEEPAIFTTHAMLRTEYEMGQAALTLSKRRGYGVAKRMVSRAISQVETANPDRAFRLDQEQVDAVRHVTGDSAIAAVVGLAGAGKSTLLAAANEAWKADGRRVLGAALAGKAAESLEDSSGIPSRTIASWELSWANGRDELQRGDILVIDEAGMVASEQMTRVLKIAEAARAKVVLVGDAMQLQPIQAGAAFRAITDRVGYAELVGVRRQRDEWARDASRQFARGHGADALAAYSERGHVVETDTREAAIARIVEDWSQARHAAVAQAAAEDRPLRGDALLVLAHTNADVKSLNDAIRTVMTASGELGQSRAFSTERGAREFAVGDRIIFLENDRFVEPQAKHLGVQHVRNGMLGTVTGTTGKRGETLLQVRLDAGRDVVFGAETYRNVDHGYAATIHKSQGSTVDRTLVLATGGMDQHLTYVAMSRHRDRADLYAALSDFEPRPDYGAERAKRPDHAAGVTGVFVETGEAQFRPDDEDADPTPYADLRNEDGRTHRLWGVSLPDALDKVGAGIGDTVTLTKDGTETVLKIVPVIDEETGAKRFEERAVERNVWSAIVVEAASQTEQEEQSAAVAHPAVFNELVNRLGRSGAKTTTLDFESEDGYRELTRDFAARRGIERLVDIGNGIEEAIERQRAWIGEQRIRLARLWERAGVALGLATERAVVEARAESKSQPVAGEALGAGAFMLAPMTRFAESVPEAARLAQLELPAASAREAVLTPVLGRIYSDPAAALTALSDVASRPSTDPRELAEDVAKRPEQFGALAGEVPSSSGSLGRRQRTAIQGAVDELAMLARGHATGFRSDHGRAVAREERRRTSMAIGVPLLSQNATARLSEIEAIRAGGGEAAYKQAFALAAEDRSVVREVKAVAEAISRRFGYSAFTDKADESTKRLVTERMSELSEGDRIALDARFEAVKRFASEQHFAERRDPSKIVLPAAADPTASAGTPAPMIPAVTSFTTPLDEEARGRALATPQNQNDRRVLAQAAERIWRDPAAVLGRIEERYVRGEDPERLAVAMASDPGKFGALRGSDRIMDRFTAAGTERKAALAAARDHAWLARAAGQSYASAFDHEKQAVKAERDRMAIAIPGLSHKAEAELKRLGRIIKSDQKGFDPAVLALSPEIKAELARVSKALDARFGRGALGRNEVAAANLVPAAQRPGFEAMRASLRTLQRAVAADVGHHIASERRMKTINRARGVEQ